MRAKMPPKTQGPEKRLKSALLEIAILTDAATATEEDKRIAKAFSIVREIQVEAFSAGEKHMLDTLFELVDQGKITDRMSAYAELDKLRATTIKGNVKIILRFQVDRSGQK